MSTPALLLTVYCCVSGGPFGLEPLISASGAGLALLLIVLTPILWALPDALTTAELAPAIPEEGGYVIWVRRALGPYWGFLNGWWTWLYTLVDAAIYPVLFTTYLSQLLQSAFGFRLLETNDTARWGVSFLVICAFTFVNIRGTKTVGQTSSVLAVGIILPFVLMTVIGLVRMAQHPMPVVHGFLPEGTGTTSALSGGLGVVMWNYLGWDALSTIAEEVEEPAKAYPRALMWGLPLVTLVYLLPTVVGLAFFPAVADWKEGVWPVIAQRVGGPWLAYAVNAAALISPLALFTASLLGSSRIPFVLAESRFLPPWLVDVHPKWGTPWRAILVCGAIYALLCTKTFKDLVSLNVVMYGIALILEGLSLVILRIKEPDLARPFRIRGGWPVLGLIATLPVVCVVTLVTLTVQEEGWPAQWLTGVAILSGPVVYEVIRRVRKYEQRTNFAP